MAYTDISPRLLRETLRHITDILTEDLPRTSRCHPVIQAGNEMWISYLGTGRDPTEAMDFDSPLRGFGGRQYLPCHLSASSTLPMA